MRLLPGILGVLLVPITYLTLRALSCSVVTAVLGSTLITFENALAAQSRLILLDSPLIFFTASTVLCFLRFTNEDARQPFTRLWWKWLVISGFSLGAVASCKWVGLFTIATLGLATLGQLWVLLGDLRVTPRIWIRHFLARAVGLIVIPVLVYLTIFRIHFWILDGSGEGDGFMSSEFQHTLRGHGMPDTYADVALGSTISLRHVHTQGGYLHSHAHNYPTGSNREPQLAIVVLLLALCADSSVFFSFFFFPLLPPRATDHALPPQGHQQRVAHPQHHHPGTRRPRPRVPRPDDLHR